jgi:hypothetical protein
MDSRQEGEMKREEQPRKEGINPRMRRDRPGEEHDDLVERDADAEDRSPKPYQDADLDPRDHGGIAE